MTDTPPSPSPDIDPLYDKFKDCPKCHWELTDGVCRSYQCCPHEKINWEGSVMDSQTCPDCSGTVNHPPDEQFDFLKETEKLIDEINKLTERIGGIPYGALKDAPQEERMKKFRELYDERKAKILRIEEINKICIEKGYITA